MENVIKSRTVKVDQGNDQEVASTSGDITVVDSAKQALDGGAKATDVTATDCIDAKYTSVKPLDRTTALEKRESSALSSIESYLEEMKGPLARVKTPGLNVLFENLRSLFVDYCKARNEMRREWLVAFAAEKTNSESYRTTRSINAQMKMSQEMVLDAIATLRARQLEISQPQD